MNTLVRMTSIFAGVAMLGLSATPGSAQPASGDAIVINALQFAKPDANQLSVRFRDLSLRDQAGKNALIHRVGFAIDSLCENSVASSNPVGAMKCTNLAWDSVRPQLDHVLGR